MMKMRKSLKMKRATQLTLFSTGLLTMAMLFLYVMIIADINADMQYRGIADYNMHNFFNPNVLIMFVAAAVLAYVASAIIIDKTLNPIRIMIFKINEIGNMDFSKRLAIDEEDDELREFAYAINDMARKLNLYIERQKRFISDASHELATPITVINGYADLLLRRGKENPSLTETGLETIKAEALRMDGLINSLLLLARSDSGKQDYVFEKVNLTLLLEESIAEAAIIAPNFTFQKNIKQNLTARCDEYAIRRVLRILLSNAIRYAENEKQIQIEASASHEMIQISVKDNGIGIPAEHLSRIFERFYRVDSSRSKKTGSSGLGLAIAKEIINAHGGNIQAYSPITKVREGTEFRITLSV